MEKYIYKAAFKKKTELDQHSPVNLKNINQQIITK